MTTFLSQLEDMNTSSDIIQEFSSRAVWKTEEAATREKNTAT